MIDESLGQGAECDENIHVFKEWLTTHGARFDKIEWPSNETVEWIYYSFTSFVDVDRRLESVEQLLKRIFRSREDCITWMTSSRQMKLCFTSQFL